jgi:hypothetical protein
MIKDLLLFLLLYPSLVFCATNPYLLYTGHQAGMFSSFLITIGLLDGYDKGEYAGVEIRLNEKEFYYDKAHGPNWWEYYFSPIRTKMAKVMTLTPLASPTSEYVARQGQSILSRKRCHYLIKKYITVRPEFLRQVDAFIQTNIHGEKLIGVHYRATDKFNSEAESISPENACVKIREVILKLHTNKIKIFVATDSTSFLQLMKNSFGSKVIAFDMKRSQDNQPIHTDREVNGYTKGQMALLDCLMLSKCDLLIRTSSNLSNVSMLFNPTVPVVRLNNPRWDGQDR